MSTRRLKRKGEINIENISNNVYIKHGITKDWLNENGFRYNRVLSDNEDSVYTLRFPLCKNGYFVTLECELSCIESTGEIRVGVYEYGTRNKYAAFYCVEYGDYSIILDKINKRINSELKKLDIKKVG